MFFYPDDGISFYRNVCEMIANILANIFLLKVYIICTFFRKLISVNFLFHQE